MDTLTEQIPFNALIIGPTNCGKTQFIVDQLRGPFRFKFEYIVLICPTYANNKTYKGVGKGDPRFIVLAPSQNDIDATLGDCACFFEGTNTLIILDDCAASKDVKGRTNKISDLAFSARHIGISIWASSQTQKSICKNFRENCAIVVAFRIASAPGLKDLFDDYGASISLDDKKLFISELETKFAHICFCLRHPFSTLLEIPSPMVCHNTLK